MRKKRGNRKFDPGRIERFLKKPPHRISEAAIAARRQKGSRRYPGNWLDTIYDEQGGRCHYCRHFMRRKGVEGSDPRWPTIDHKTPISAGGRNRRENVVVACRECNQEKGSLPYDAYVEIWEARRPLTLALPRAP